MKSDKQLFLAALLASALLPGAALAAKVAVSNCSNEFVTVCAYDSHDSTHSFPSSKKGLHPGTAGKVTCGTSSSCRIMIVSGNSSCEYYPTLTGVANYVWHPPYYVGNLGNLSYQFFIEDDWGRINEIGNSSHTFDDGAFCTAQNGQYCEQDSDCYSGNCENNECILAGATEVTPMCSPSSGTEMQAGDVFSSCDGAYSLIMQADGNLVVYNELGQPIWATGTSGSNWAAFQSDGNFVIYSPWGAIWATGTNGNWGSKLLMQDDGNLVIYNASGKAIWASNTRGR